METYEVKIGSATLLRDRDLGPVVSFILTCPDYGAKYTFQLEKDCDHKRLDLLFDYAQVSDINLLNGKVVRLIVNDTGLNEFSSVAIGHKSSNRFFLINATTVVEMKSSDVAKLI